MANITGFNKDAKGIFIVKDPTANVRYTLDWSQYLPTGNVISSATVTIETIGGDTAPLAHPTDAATDVTTTDTTVSIRLEAGSAGNVYQVACTIVTDGGDTDTRRFRVVVKENNLQ
jgi:hypothetical protein